MSLDIIKLKSKLNKNKIDLVDSLETQTSNKTIPYFTYAALVLGTASLWNAQCYIFYLVNSITCVSAVLSAQGRNSFKKYYSPIAKLTTGLNLLIKVLSINYRGLLIKNAARLTYFLVSLFLLMTVCSFVFNRPNNIRFISVWNKNLINQISDTALFFNYVYYLFCNEVFSSICQAAISYATDMFLNQFLKEYAQIDALRSLMGNAHTLYDGLIAFDLVRLFSFNIYIYLLMLLPGLISIAYALRQGDPYATFLKIEDEDKAKRKINLESSDIDGVREYRLSSISDRILSKLVIAPILVSHSVFNFAQYLSFKKNQLSINLEILKYSKNKNTLINSSGSFENSADELDSFQDANFGNQTRHSNFRKCLSGTLLRLITSSILIFPSAIKEYVDLSSPLGSSLLMAHYFVKNIALCLPILVNFLSCTKIYNAELKFAAGIKQIDNRIDLLNSQEKSILSDFFLFGQNRNRLLELDTLLSKKISITENYKILLVRTVEQFKIYNTMRLSFGNTYFQGIKLSTRYLAKGYQDVVEDTEKLLIPRPTEYSTSTDRLIPVLYFITSVGLASCFVTNGIITAHTLKFIDDV